MPSSGSRSPRSPDWAPRQSVAGDATVGLPATADPVATFVPAGFADPAGEAHDPSIASAGETSLAEAMSLRLGGRAIALAGLVVVLGIVLSRVLGFVRTGVLSAEFGGDNVQLAAFWTAFRIPDTLYQLVAAGAVGSALVPVVSELIAHGEEARARRVVGTLANLMVGTLLPLAVIVWLIAPAVVSTLLAPGYHGEQQQLTTDMTRALLLSPILLAVGAVATAALQTVGVFGIPAISPNVYNLAIILAAIFLTPFFGIQALVIGVILGAAGHVLTQIPALLRHRLYVPVLDVHDPAVHDVLRLMAPRALGLGATQLMFFVYVSLITVLPHGDTLINIWTIGFTSLQIPVGLVGVPLGIIMLPPLSQAFARGDIARYRSLVDRSLRLLLYVTLPINGLAVALAAPGMTLLWGHGRYNAANVADTTTLFLVFMLGLVAHVAITLLAPVFFAAKDTKTPVAAALLAVGVDVVGALVFLPSLGLQALGLAIGLGAWAEMGLLVYMMERRIGFDLAPVGRAALQYLPGAILASVAAFVVARLFEARFGAAPGFALLMVDLTIAGCVATAIYLAWSRLLRLEELDSTIEMARSMLRRH